MTEDQNREELEPETSKQPETEKSTVEIRHRKLDKPETPENKKKKLKKKRSKKQPSAKEQAKKEEKRKARIGAVKSLPRTTVTALKNHSDGVRSAGIIALAVCMVGQSGFFWSRILDRDSTPKGTIAHAIVRWLDNRNANRSDVIEAAAYPTKLAVRSDDGLYGIQYSAAGTKTAWELTEDVWSSALSAAKKIEVSSESEYSMALQHSMMFAEFDGSIPLTLIAGWIGAETPTNGDSINCGGILLTREDADSYRLYFRDSKTDVIYSAGTELTDVDFDSAASSFAANDCTMAVETETQVFPDTLQFTQAQSFDSITIAPYTGSMTGLLEALGMDGQSAQETAYSTQDGTMVYVGDGTAVRVTSGGVMTYKAEEGVRAYTGSLTKTDREQKCAQLGYTISSEFLEAMGSGGEAHLTKAYTNDEGRYVTVFALHIDGVPVDNELGYFARFEFDEGALVRSDAVLRTCVVTGSAVTVMPEKVAASARNDSTALLSLRYIDSASLGADDRWSAESTSDGTTVDDSWVNDGSDILGADTQTEDGLWTDSTSYDDTYYDSMNSTSSTLNSTGDSVSAQAQWKFILYHEDEKAQENIAGDFNQDNIDFTICHMPDLLTPLDDEGGAE